MLSNHKYIRPLVESQAEWEQFKAIHFHAGVLGSANQIDLVEHYIRCLNRFKDNPSWSYETSYGLYWEATIICSQHWILGKLEWKREVTDQDCFKYTQTNGLFYFVVAILFDLNTMFARLRAQRDIWRFIENIHNEQCAYIQSLRPYSYVSNFGRQKSLTFTNVEHAEFQPILITPKSRHHRNSNYPKGCLHHHLSIQWYSNE